MTTIGEDQAVQRALERIPTLTAAGLGELIDSWAFRRGMAYRGHSADRIRHPQWHSQENVDGCICEAGQYIAGCRQVVDAAISALRMGR